MSLLPLGLHAGMFVRAPVKAVADCLVGWRNEENVGRGTVVTRRLGNLQDVVTHLAERTFNPRRAGLIGLRPNWTAYLDNHSFEWLHSSSMFVLCGRLRTEAYYFSVDDEPGSPHLGDMQFTAYRSKESKVFERQVVLHRESGWEFSAVGEPLPCEHLEAYQQEQERNRLTADLLRSYADQLGIPLADDAAYSHEVVLLKWGEQPPESDESAMAKLFAIFGKPKWILDRYGWRRPGS